MPRKQFSNTQSFNEKGEKSMREERSRSKKSKERMKSKGKDQRKQTSPEVVELHIYMSE